ncbi:MAG: hypothetical protein ACQETE_00770 [Bacteroidota bacterium]
MDKYQILSSNMDKLETIFAKIIDGLFQDLESIDHKTSKKELDRLSKEYRGLKKRILLTLFEQPIHKIDSPYLSDIRKKLQKLTIDGDPFIPKSLKKDNVGKHIFDLLEVQFSMDDLAQKHYYPSHSPLDYMESMIKSNLIFIKHDQIPDKLKKYVQEIRECIAMENTLAAISLLRTTIEIAIANIAKMNGLDDMTNPTSKEVSDFWLDYKNDIENDSNSKFLITEADANELSLGKLQELIYKLDKFKPLNDELFQIRKVTNAIIHGNERPVRIKGQNGKERFINMTNKELLDRSFQVIHELYEAN